MKIASWNVNSLKVRLAHLKDWVGLADPDVICLQETKTVDETFPAEAIRDLGYPHLAFAGQKTYNGVAICSRLPLQNVHVGFLAGEPDEQRRLIRATIDGVVVINGYIPNGSEVGSEKFAYKLNWLSRFASELAHYSPSTPLLFCGDMNIALTDRDVWDPFEAEGELLYHPLEREAIQRILAWGLTDIYRQLNPTGRDYSWWDYRMLRFQKNRGYRIDHIFLSAPLVSRAKDVKIWRETRKWEKPSDHAPVVVDLT